MEVHPAKTTSSSMHCSWSARPAVKKLLPGLQVSVGWALTLEMNLTQGSAWVMSHLSAFWRKARNIWVQALQKQDGRGHWKKLETEEVGRGEQRPLGRSGGQAITPPGAKLRRFIRHNAHLLPDTRSSVNFTVIVGQKMQLGSKLHLVPTPSAHDLYGNDQRDYGTQSGPAKLQIQDNGMRCQISAWLRKHFIRLARTQRFLLIDTSSTLTPNRHRGNTWSSAEKPSALEHGSTAKPPWADPPPPLSSQQAKHVTNTPGTQTGGKQNRRNVSGLPLYC